MAATDTKKSSNKKLRIDDIDWDAMLKRRDQLEDDIEKSLQRESVVMASVAIDERANLSAKLIKIHNMRERDTVSLYRKQLDRLKEKKEEERNAAQDPAANQNGPEDQQGAA